MQQLHAGQFQNAFPDLVSLQDYQIKSVEDLENGQYRVTVEAICGAKTVALQFLLARKDIGRKKGALMTRQLLVLQ